MMKRIFVFLVIVGVLVVVVVFCKFFLGGYCDVYGKVE